MQFLGKSLHELTLQDLQSLVDNEVKEGRDIDYKETLPGNSDSERKQFLADASSFANAGGGHLLYGVREKRDARNEATGLPEGFPGIGDANPAVEQQRLEQMLQTGISPRMPGIRLHAVPLGGGSCVLVVHIPRSWAGPHIISFQDWNRFYSRNSSGKYLLDVAELRAAFLGSEAPSERIRQFRLERVARVAAGETPVPLPSGPKVVLHLFPMQALDATLQVDTSAAEEKTALMPPMGAGGWNHRYNFDGFLTYEGSSDIEPSTSYTQLFRSGAVEAVGVLHTHPQWKAIGPGYELDLICCLERYLQLYRTLQVEPPLLLMLTLTGVRGHSLALDAFFSPRLHGTVDREILVCPPSLIDDHVTGAATALRSSLDSVWNAFGYPRALTFDQDGNWRRTR